jgi:outer membrane protein assembly factor BamA
MLYAFWPFDRYRRAELFGGFVNYNQRYNDPGLEQIAQQYQQQQFGRNLVSNGNVLPMGVAFVQETTIFREFGPLDGNTMRISFEASPALGDTLSRQTVDVDLRKYVRLGTTGLLALRARGFNSWGESPNFLYYGGNSEMRGYEYLEFLGNRLAFLNAEIRFPLIEAMLTPIGVMGGIRGLFFVNLGGGAFEGQSIDPARSGAAFKVMSSKTETYTPLTGGIRQTFNPATNQFELIPITGPPVRVSGLRLVDARASYGFGLQTFALGFPVHFDWAWRSLFNKDWEDVLFAPSGGSAEFRKPKLSMWIGYDF